MSWFASEIESANCSGVRRRTVHQRVRLARRLAREEVDPSRRDRGRADGPATCARCRARGTARRAPHIPSTRVLRPSVGTATRSRFGVAAVACRDGRAPVLERDLLRRSATVVREQHGLRHRGTTASGIGHVRVARTGRDVRGHRGGCRDAIRRACTRRGRSSRRRTRARSRRHVRGRCTGALLECVEQAGRRTAMSSSGSSSFHAAPSGPRSLRGIRVGDDELLAVARARRSCRSTSAALRSNRARGSDRTSGTDVVPSQPTGTCTSAYRGMPSTSRSIALQSSGRWSTVHAGTVVVVVGGVGASSPTAHRSCRSCSRSRPDRQRATTRARKMSRRFTRSLSDPIEDEGRRRRCVVADLVRAVECVAGAGETARDRRRAVRGCTSPSRHAFARLDPADDTGRGRDRMLLAGPARAEPPRAVRRSRARRDA